MLNFPSSPSTAAAVATMNGGHYQFPTRSRSWQPNMAQALAIPPQFANGLAYQPHYMLASNKAAQVPSSQLAATMSMQFSQPTPQYYHQYWTPSPSSHSSGCSNSASITPTRSTTFSAYNSSEDVQVQAQLNFQLNDASLADMRQRQRRMTAAFHLFDRRHRSQVQSFYPRDCESDITAKLRSMWQNMAATNQQEPWIQAAHLPYKHCAALLNFDEIDPVAEREHDSMLPLLNGNNFVACAEPYQPRADFRDKRFLPAYSIAFSAPGAIGYNVEPASVHSAVVSCHAGGNCVIQALSPSEIRPSFDYYTHQQPQQFKVCAPVSTSSNKTVRKPRRKNATQTTTASSSRTLSSNGSRDAVAGNNSSITQPRIRKPNNNRKRPDNNRQSASKFATVLSAPGYGNAGHAGLKSRHTSSTGGVFQPQQHSNGFMYSGANAFAAVTSIANGLLQTYGGAPAVNKEYSAATTPTTTPAQGLARSGSNPLYDDFATQPVHQNQNGMRETLSPSVFLPVVGGGQPTAVNNNSVVASPSIVDSLAWINSSVFSGSEDLSLSPTTMGSALKDLLSDYSLKQHYEKQQPPFLNSFNSQPRMTSEMLSGRRVPSGRDTVGNSLEAFSPRSDVAPQQQQKIQPFMPLMFDMDDANMKSASPHLTGGDSFLINTFAPPISSYTVQHNLQKKKATPAAKYEINVFPVRSTDDLIGTANDDDAMQQCASSRLSPSLNWLPAPLSCCSHMSSDAMSNYVDADGDSLMPSADAGSVWNLEPGSVSKTNNKRSSDTGGYRALDPGVALQQFGQFNAFNDGFDFNLDALMAEGVSEKHLDTSAASALYIINNGPKKTHASRVLQRTQGKTDSKIGKTLSGKVKIDVKQSTTANQSAFHQNMDAFNATFNDRLVDEALNGTVGMEPAEI